MVTVEVMRGAGARDGGEILAPLLGDSLPAAIARGRAELDANAHARDRVRLLLDYTPGLRLGQRVAVADPDLGAVWQGDVVGLEHRWTGQLAETQLDVDRPVGVAG